MNAPADSAASLAVLSSPALARRLADLRGCERNVQVDFLLHLAEYDTRRAWAEAGYGSLWEYCLEVLQLREGAAWRRIGAMKLLRRFPGLEGALREGKLCLTTVNQLGPLLTDENLAEVVERAAFLSKADTERLVVSIRPRPAPKDGIRKAGNAMAPVPGSGSLSSGSGSGSGAGPGAGPGAGAEGGATAPLPFVPLSPPSPGAAGGSGAPALLLVHPSAPTAPVGEGLAAALAQGAAPAHRTELRPVSADTYSLRVTLDAVAKAELDRLVGLLSHKTGGNLAAIVAEAIRCAVAKHGRRKGAVAPEWKRTGADAERRASASAPRAVPAPAEASASPQAPAPLRAVASTPASSSPPTTGEKEAPGARYIPMEVKRTVWDRDEGRCAWTSADGKRCGSTWKLEFGHVQPFAFGGRPTADGLRLECAVHNRYEAVRVFGAEHMAKFLGGSTSSGGRHGG